MTDQVIGEVESMLGYSFRDRSLLLQALTHSSRRADLQYSNERMEFLGDALLGAIVSFHLYQRFPESTEGELTRVKSAVVSRAALGRVAREMDLGRHLIVAKGVAQEMPEALNGEELDPVRRLPASLLANALEAVIAAVFLDGGMRALRDLFERHMAAQVAHACETSHTHNYKSSLQQYAQSVLADTPTYRVTAEEGPDHVKLFEVVTLIAGKAYGKGRGRTKKEAEQMAAAKTLELLQAARNGERDTLFP